MRLVDLGAACAFLVLGGPLAGGRVQAIERSEMVMGAISRVMQCARGGAGEGAVAAALGRMREVDRRLSLYQAESELWRLNERGWGRWVVVGDDLFRVLERAREISQATAGAFDVTVLPLMVALGSYRGIRMPLHSGKRAAISFFGLLLDPESRSARFVMPGMGVDLGAIGKGYGVDAAYRVLVGRGSQCGLAEIGGTVRVWGKRGAGSWRIGIRDPKSPATLAGVLTIDGGAVASSGNYFRRADDGLREHILDPRMRKPARGQLAVTVWAPDATTADALSTALFVLGIDAARKILHAHFPMVSAFFFYQAGSEIAISSIGPGAGAWRPLARPVRPGSTTAEDGGRTSGGRG